MLTKAPRGTRDILPGEVEKWHRLENLAREICRLYGYGEIRTPIFEHTELFQRGVGEETDIVSKEMYTFYDRGERKLTLRPENTAAVVRAFLEHKLYAAPQPVKLYYIGPMFRYDRPQAGRYRQFHQFGVEALGSLNPALDAEIIYVAYEFYRQLGIKDLKLEVNTVGCNECRPLYRNKLKEHFRPHLDNLCPDCTHRFEKNPLRILDCKEEKCRVHFDDVPVLKDNLCQECHSHFKGLIEDLTNLGVEFVINPFIVRGLDYYTKTVFEFISLRLGAQSSLGGGGRYDDLVEVCGGPSTPGIGFAVGMERILLALEEEGLKQQDAGLHVYVAVISKEANPLAGKVIRDLRKSKISCDRDYMDRSLKAQLKQADRFNASLTLFLGGEEMQQGRANIKVMATGEQLEISMEVIVEKINEMLEQEV